MPPALPFCNARELPLLVVVEYPVPRPHEMTAPTPHLCTFARAEPRGNDLV